MIELTGSMRSGSYTEEVLVAEIQRLRGELTLAEEGLANYALEVARLEKRIQGHLAVLRMTTTESERQMRQTLREMLDELQLGDSRHDLQAKIIATPGFGPHPGAG